jgi:hypothetical protein
VGPHADTTSPKGRAISGARSRSTTRLGLTRAARWRAGVRSPLCEEAQERDVFALLFRGVVTIAPS